MRRSFFVLTTLSACLVLSSCITPVSRNQDPTDALMNDFGISTNSGNEKSSVGTFAVGGATLCAMVAALTGGSKSAVATSAGVCGVGGAVVGSLNDKGRREYNDEQRAYTARYEQAQADVQAADIAARRAATDLKNAQAEMASLQRQARSDRELIAQSADLRQKLADQQTNLRERRMVLQTERSQIDGELTRLGSQLASTPNDAMLLQAHAELTKRRDRLLVSVRRLNGVEDQIAQELARAQPGTNRSS